MFLNEHSKHGMWKTSQLVKTTCRSTFIVTTCVLLISVHASAEPILLARLSQHASGRRAGDPPPPAIPFDFEAYLNPSNSFKLFFSWLDDYGLNDVGKIFIAPTDILTGVNQAVADPEATYVFVMNEILSSSEFGLDFPGSGGCDPLGCVNKYVSNLGVYTVTSVERTIDELEITPVQGQAYIFEGTQTIRFYGVPIPEPSSTTLLATALATTYALVTVRKRRTPHLQARV